MPKTRVQVASAIGLAFLNVKRTAARLSGDNYRLVAKLMDARHQAQIPYAEAEQLLSDARRVAEIGAEQDAMLARMHLNLADMAHRLNLDPKAYGDDEPTEKKFMADASAGTVKLRSVA